MTEVRAILFDMGGVLCRVDEAPVWLAWQQHTGVSGDELRRELYDRGLKSEFDSGLKAPGGVALFLATRWDVPFTTADWRRIWGLAVNADPAMDALAADIAQRLPCALASTTDKVHHEKLMPELSCLRAFKAQVVSYRVGYLKPDPMFYRACLDALGSEASHTLFIDDRPENVGGAVAAGMQGRLFKDIETLQADLARLGVG